MTQTLNAAICAQMQATLETSEIFNYEALWVGYKIGISVGEQHAWFEIAKGKITQFGSGVPADLRYRLVGEHSAWDKLADPERNGGVYRLYREKAVKIEGDVIQALRDLKVVWWLTECLGDIWKKARVN